MNYEEPTSGATIALPEGWEVSIGSTPYAPIIASLPASNGDSFSIVITVECTPSEFNNLDTYAAEQVKLFTTHKQIHSARVLGIRSVTVQGNPAVLSSCMFIQNDTELCNYQLFTKQNQISTTLTFTAPLAQLRQAFFVAQELREAFTPASDLYRFGESA